MSKEAMKLALENIEERCTLGAWEDDAGKAITAPREALAKPDFWEGYVPEPVNPPQQALDKMAENARELGLDYEPLTGTQVSRVWWDGEKLMAKPIPLIDIYKTAQQEPVAWIDEFGNVFPFGAQRGPKHLNEPMKPLYTAPAQRKRITDEQIEREWQFLHDEEGNPPDHHDFARAIESALGIKENT